MLFENVSTLSPIGDKKVVSKSPRLAFFFGGGEVGLEGPEFCLDERYFLFAVDQQRNLRV